jgi:hypothetical protein
MKTRSLIASLVLALGPASPTVVSAGDSIGAIAFPRVNLLGIFMFSAGPHLTPPSCSLVNGNEWAFDAKTPEGKAMMSAVMMAYGLGKQLKVSGTNNCNDWSDREKPSYVEIQG